MFSSSIKGEIRKVSVVVVQWRQRDVQKSVMYVQSCCFANLKAFLTFSLPSTLSLLNLPNYSLLTGPFHTLKPYNFFFGHHRPDRQVGLLSSDSVLVSRCPPLARSLVSRARILPCLKRKIRDCSQSSRNSLLPRREEMTSLFRLFH